MSQPDGALPASLGLVSAISAGPSASLALPLTFYKSGLARHQHTAASTPPLCSAHPTREPWAVSECSFQLLLKPFPINILARACQQADVFQLTAGGWSVHAARSPTSPVGTLGAPRSPLLFTGEEPGEVSEGPGGGGTHAGWECCSLGFPLGNRVRHWMLRALTSVVVECLGLGAPRVSPRAEHTVGALPNSGAHLLCPHLLPRGRA